MGKIIKLVTLTTSGLLVLTGCVATSSLDVSDTTETPQSGTSWASLDSCNAFQEVVWAQDNLVEEALVAVDEQRSYLLDSVDLEQEIIQETLEYLDLIETLARGNKAGGSFLDAMVQQPDEANYENLRMVHEKYASLCDSVGFSIVNDGFLIAERNESSAETPSAKPSPSASTNNSLRCLDSMRKASEESNSSIAERYLKDTAEYCGGKAEWYQALRLYPYAMGFPDVMGNELEILCYNYGSSPACRNP